MSKPLRISQESWQMLNGRLGMVGDMIVGAEMVGGDQITRRRIVVYTTSGAGPLG